MAQQLHSWGMPGQLCVAASHVLDSVYGTRMERDFEGVGWCAATSCARKFAKHSDVSWCSGGCLSLGYSLINWNISAP
jgi:hypothetical protein